MGSDTQSSSKRGAAAVSRIYAVFRENERGLRRFVRRLAPRLSDVEDITQEALLRALEAEQKFEISQPRAYLFSITRHLVLDEIQKRTRSIVRLLDDMKPESEFEDGLALEENLSTREQLVIFGQAISSLPKKCGQVFLLKKVYGYSHKEISAIMNMSTSTVEKHVAEGYKRCTKFLEKYIDEDKDGSDGYFKNLVKWRR